MTQYRVHELAARCGVTADEVIDFLAGAGRKVRGPSAVLGESDAARVRRKFGARRGHSAEGATRTAGESDRSAGVPVAEFAAAVAAGPVERLQPVSAGLAQQDLLNPFGAAAMPAVVVPSPAAVAAPRQVRPVSRPQRPVPPRRVPTGTLQLAETVVVNEYFEDWDRRDFSRDERQLWIEAGLRPDEHGLADRCRTAGILPENLKLKLSGRLALARLRDGETPTSVWARIQDGEHEPRKPTRLSGRFKL